MALFGSRLGAQPFMMPQGIMPMQQMPTIADRVAQAFLGQPRETSGMGSAADRNVREGEMMKRGYADLSLGNLGKVAGMLSNMTPKGIIGMGVQGMLHQAFPETIGSPMPEFSGYGRYDQDLVGAVQSGKMTRGEADRVQRDRDAQKGPSGASHGASHGQVSGGGTGSRGGGLTAGGPR